MDQGQATSGLGSQEESPSATGWRGIASAALPLAAAAAGIVRPQAAYPLLSLAQMMENSDYREQALADKREARATEQREKSSTADYLSRQYGITMPTDVPVSQMATFAQMEASRLKAQRDEDEKTRQRQTTGSLAGLSAKLPDTPPEETLAAISALGVGNMTPEQFNEVKDLRNRAEDLRGRVATARNFEAPFAQQHEGGAMGLPALPEEPSLGLDPFAPEGFRGGLGVSPISTGSIPYSTVPENVMRASEQFVRGKAPKTEELIAMGLEPSKVPGGPKYMDEQRKTRFEAEKAQRESETASREAGDFPELGRAPKNDMEWFDLAAQGNARAKGATTAAQESKKRDQLPTTASLAWAAQNAATPEERQKALHALRLAKETDRRDRIQAEYRVNDQNQLIGTGINTDTGVRVWGPTVVMDNVRSNPDILETLLGGKLAPPAGNAPPPAPKAPGTRVRDPKTGRTGTVPPGQPIPPGLEVIR